MKIVIGVDVDHLYREAVHLVGRLNFASCQTILVHVLNTARAPVGVGIDGGHEQGEFGSGQSLADKVLREASRICMESPLGRNREERSISGRPSREIVKLADEEEVDLIAVGSRRQGPIGSAFLGSVGRTLAVSGDRSFLIARSGVTTRGNVRAVFATDHSEYSNKCLEKLLQWDPLGLTELQIVFASECDREVLRRATGCGDDEEPALPVMLERVKSRGEALVEQCLASGRLAEYHMVDDYAIDALRNILYESKADLLIMGARGHGLFERVLIGSLSLHMVVAESFSVLVLRLPKEETV